VVTLVPGLIGLALAPGRRGDARVEAGRAGNA
jgi:hypothetical protein